MGVLGGLILRPAIPRDGLVAEYLASNNFLDTSGNGYNGVNNNVTFGNDRHSNGNSAFVLNGTTAFVNIDASLAGLSTNTEGAMSCWINPTDATPSPGESIINMGDASAGNRLGYFINATGTLIAVCEKAGTIQWIVETDSPVFSDGVWAHTLINHNSIEPSLYVSGIKPAQTFSNSTDKTAWFNDVPNIDNARIGTIKFNTNPDTNFFTGSEDNIRLYDRELTTSEITILANE